MKSVTGRRVLKLDLNTTLLTGNRWTGGVMDQERTVTLVESAGGM
jgi:hypothetical protein